MIIKQLTVQNWRCHDRYNLQITAPKLAIIGPNGSGKTSLLEAIYLIAQGKSFKDSDNDLVKTNRRWLRVDAEVDGSSAHQRTFKLQLKAETKDKTIAINQKIHRRLPQAQKIPVVLFEPDDMNLIIGSPTRRRKYLDNLISQVNPLHSRLLSRYAKALKQRNDLIKQMLARDGIVNKEQLFSWDALLSQYGGQIIKNRLQMTELLNQRINAIYQQITGLNDQISFRYQFEADDINHLEQKIFNQLLNQTHFMLGTTIGPHRHDLEIYFNHKLACKCASRGETRSIILAMKLIEIDIIKQQTGLNPIVLLDDVLSELDRSRQQFLMDYTNQSQIILTSTNVDNLTDYQIVELTKN